MSLLVLAARLAVAAVLVWAGVAKLLDPTAFADEIANYRIVPALSPFFAATLPSVEVVTGLALLVAPRAWRAAAALLAVALLAVFTAAVASAWRRGWCLKCSTVCVCCARRA